MITSLCANKRPTTRNNERPLSSFHVLVPGLAPSFHNQSTPQTQIKPCIVRYLPRCRRAWDIKFIRCSLCEFSRRIVWASRSSTAAPLPPSKNSSETFQVRVMCATRFLSTKERGKKQHSSVFLQQLWLLPVWMACGTPLRLPREEHVSFTTTCNSETIHRSRPSTSLSYP